MLTKVNKMNRKIKIAILLIVLGGALIVSQKSLDVFWPRFMDFTNPGYYDLLEKQWENKSVDFLIAKLGHPSMYDSVASSILARRPDRSKINKLVSIIEKDSNWKRKNSALAVLFYWNENIALNESMKIIEKMPENNQLYLSALRSLAQRKYDPAFKYVLDLAKRSDAISNGSVAMLASYGKADSLPFLESLRSQIRHSDKIIEQIDTETIANAIRSIKEKNGIKDNE